MDKIEAYVIVELPSQIVSKLIETTNSITLENDKQLKQSQRVPKNDVP